MTQLQTKHIIWTDLMGDGVLREIAVMKQDNNNLYYIRTDHLDTIDLQRLSSILQRRDANNYALWDLMSQVTLKNGENALTFFQQFVMQKTRSGQHIRPGSGYGADLTVRQSLTSQPDAAPVVVQAPVVKKAKE